MFNSIYDFRNFYNSQAGRIVKRVVAHKLRGFWPDSAGMRVMGCGYAPPYMNMIGKDAERFFLLMPAALGAHSWPHDSPNIVCLSEESELPLETNSVDRIFLVHSLEYSEIIHPYLEELWRVLKSNGRMLVVAPNRLGMWARAEWSPFGHGRPFSLSQLCHYLRTAGFVQENASEGLFIPPVRSQAIFRSVSFFEGVGRYVYPALGGLHFLEVSKQLYAPTGGELQRRVRNRGRGILIPETAGLKR
jgi:SAM-dependent methyltransferase